MKRGKRICNELKAVRRRIADENGIELHQTECKHTGYCRGTCPKCEAEVRYLEQTLIRRIAAGRAATVAGLSLSLAACGGSAKPTLSIDTPLDTTLTDTASPSDTLVNPETDTPLPDIPVPGDVDVVLGFTTEEEPDTSELIVGDIAPPSATINEETDTEGEVFVFVEEEPSFPGGDTALYDFIAKNLRFPDLACENNVTGTVVVRFVVEKDGSIGDVVILRDIGAGCGKEAARVVRSMPKWKPGHQSGRKVRCEYTLPIQFSL